MTNLLLARLFLLLMVGTQSVVATSVDYSTYVGKFTSWEIDKDLNGYVDTTLTMSNIVSINPIISSPDDLECDLSEGWGLDMMKIFGTSLVWEGIDLVTDDDTLESGDPYGAVGVTRTTIILEYYVEDQLYTVIYDEDTHILIAIYINHSPDYYLYITDTNLFLTTKEFSFLIIILSIVFLAIIVVYVIGIVFSDKKKHSIRARFDQDFWNS